MAKRRGRKSKKGDALLNQVIKLTGLPSLSLKHELKEILERKNIDVSSLTVDQLRGVAASYLREIMGGILDKYHLRRNESNH